MNTVNLVQILDEDACISHNANTLNKGTYLAILPQAMAKQMDRWDFLTLVWQPLYKKENSELKPVKLCF